MKACLIGKTLKHSFSKQIHNMLGVQYDLCEIEQEHLADFVRQGDYRCFNVTIPYKQAIIPHLHRLDSTAQLVGAVNTVCVRDGMATGYNTDILGMQYMLQRCNVSLQGKNVTILGTGGTSKTAQALAKMQGAAQVNLVGLEENINYGNYWQLTDTQIVINTTPVGMFPDNNGCLVDLTKFPKLKFVADVIYNPLKTRLLLQAEEMGIAHIGGLPMLVYQAVKAEEIWQGKDFSDKTECILKQIQKQVQNVVLVGMPSSGKSTVGKILAKNMGKRFVDLDEEIEKSQNATVAEIFRQNGEEYFRKTEAEAVQRFSKLGGLVIATGGGTVLSEENRKALAQNGFVVWLQRDLSLLSTENRPLSQQKGVEKLYAERKHLYAKANCTVQNTVAQTAAKEIEQQYEKYLGNQRA